MITPGQQIGVNAAGALIGGVIGLGSSALQHKYNKQLASYQNDMNIQNWNMQNEYNSPINQRKRLEEAGLNPALMYGNGATSTSNASSLPSYQQLGVDISSNMLSAMQMAQMAANIRNTEADTQGKEIDNESKSALNQALIDNYLQDTKTKRSQEVYTFKLSDKAEVDMTLAQKQIDLLYEDISLRIAQTDNVKQETSLKKAQEALIILQQTMVESQTDNIREDTSLKKTQKGAQEAVKVYNEAQTRRVNEMLPYEKGVSQEDINLKHRQARRVEEMLPYEKGVAQQNINVLNAKWLISEWEKNYRQQTGFSPDAGMWQMVNQFLGNLSMKLTSLSGLL